MTLAVQRAVVAASRRTSLRCLHASSSRTSAAFSTSTARPRRPGSQPPYDAALQDEERVPTSWTEYMGGKNDADEDSPWASLDEIADGYRDPNSTSSTPPLKASAATTTAAKPASEWESTAVMAAEAYASSRLASLRQSPPTQQFASPSRLTHLREADNSQASMVDVSAKATTKRTAKASCRVIIPEHVLALLSNSEIDPELRSGAGGHVRRKGPVLHTAQLAGIMAAKRTSELIPLCHGLHLSHVDVKLDIVRGCGMEPETPPTRPASRLGGFAPEQPQDWDHAIISDAADSQEHYINVECIATTKSPTGVEMEALTGASIASLTLWDMLKSAGGREMRIEGMMVTRKTGGKSGDFEREKRCP